MLYILIRNMIGPNSASELDYGQNSKPKQVSSEKCTFRLILFPTVNSLLLHSAVQSADAAHLLSSTDACIKHRAKHINSMCWQTVERLVSRTRCTGYI